MQMGRHEHIVDVLGELVSRPFLPPVLFSDIEFTNVVAVKGNSASLNQRVVAVHSHRAVIMRDRKGVDFLVKLLFAPHSSVQFDDPSHGESHTVSILSICNIESNGAALHLAHEEWKVLPPRAQEVGGMIPAVSRTVLTSGLNLPVNRMDLGLLNTRCVK